MDSLKKLLRTAHDEPAQTAPEAIKNIYRSANYKHKGLNFEINNWEISEFVVNELIPAIGSQPFPLNELMLMVGTITTFRPTHIFEWGTHLGKSARVFSETFEHFRIGGRIYSIDLPDNSEHIEHPHQERGMYVKDRYNVKLIQGDGLTDSLKLLKKLKPKRPLFFIDGDHSYEAVEKEFGTLMKVAPRAVFLLHDTFYQTAESGYNTGPYRAMRKILKNNKNYKVISTATGLPGMSLVYRKDIY